MKAERIKKIQFDTAYPESQSVKQALLQVWNECEQEMGYTKVITTPHVMSDYYKNGPSNLLPKLAELKAHLIEKGINLEMEVAAEYMIDDAFEAKINNNEILSFGGSKKYVLLEMPFLEEARNFKSAIFELQINGFTPILAHPERYTYYHQKKR
jgi:tyrosine-protein phosphatase YwqE